MVEFVSTQAHTLTDCSEIMFAWNLDNGADLRFYKFKGSVELEWRQANVF